MLKNNLCLLLGIILVFANMYAQDSSAVAGLKFWDKNGNGMPDAGEPLLQGWVIYADLNHNGIMDPGEPSSTTDAFGQFTIILPQGKFQIRELIKDGWYQTKPGKPNFFYSVDTKNPLDNLFFGNDSTIYDFGDLPNDGLLNFFNTTLPLGPRHVTTGPQLGDKRDVEPDGQPDVTATGDDADGNDDEDGVKFISFQPGGNGTVEVTVNGIPIGGFAFLSAWIDFNGDGTFGGGENIIASLAMLSGKNTITFPIPPDVPKGGYARFRLSSDAHSVTTPDGEAPDGEVEDYVAFGLDYGDSHNLYEQAYPLFPGGYPTFLSENGARHIAISNIRLGNSIDSDNPVHPSLYSNGDDNYNLSDEDGIEFVNGYTVLFHGPDPDNANNFLTLYGFQLGATVNIKPLASSSGYLNLWIDWNSDGDWEDIDEHVIVDKSIESGPNYTHVSFTVPQTASLGLTYARYRFSTHSGLDYFGPASNGEVEDYLYQILPLLDYGDTPENYPTLAVDDGPKNIIATYYLGVSNDPDMDGQPDFNAMGDDNDGNDDEDGIVFLDSLVSANSVRIQITASTPIGVPGYLNAWIDFNRNGEWENSEQIFTDLSLFDGTDTLTFSVPDSSVNGLTYARFRFTDGTGYTFKDPSVFLITGYGVGEIEDYLVNISGSATNIQQYDNLPKEFKLLQNYPNPFNPATTITYDIAKHSFVSLKIYDVLGREVATLVEKRQNAGNFKIQFDASNLSSGIYLYRLNAGEFVSTKKFVVLK